ncbi:hypothetical protein QBC35DRAFT_540301 [Podospora australis]|uniref:Uncharacterized protein n=1 Tax=Podospora australis TaxID=1536484 RepID=A0AAN6WZ09_9PEZI|nr:hypothetical protein QBC35DRAFT_540301 [Podospora australis]
MEVTARISREPPSGTVPWHQRTVVWYPLYLLHHTPVSAHFAGIPLFRAGGSLWRTQNRRELLSVAQSAAPPSGGNANAPFGVCMLHCDGKTTFCNTFDLRSRDCAAAPVCSQLHLSSPMGPRRRRRRREPRLVTALIDLFLLLYQLKAPCSNELTVTITVYREAAKAWNLPSAPLQGTTRGAVRSKHLACPVRSLTDDSYLLPRFAYALAASLHSNQITNRTTHKVLLGVEITDYWNYDTLLQVEKGMPPPIRVIGYQRCKDGRTGEAQKECPPESSDWLQAPPDTRLWRGFVRKCLARPLGIIPQDETRPPTLIQPLLSEGTAHSPTHMTLRIRHAILTASGVPPSYGSLGCIQASRISFSETEAAGLKWLDVARSNPRRGEQKCLHVKASDVWRRELKPHSPTTTAMKARCQIYGVPVLACGAVTTTTAGVLYSKTVLGRDTTSLDTTNWLHTQTKTPFCAVPFPL